MAVYNDIQVGTDWVDVYTVSGVTVGASLRLQNKGLIPFLLVESPTQPTGDSGPYVMPFSHNVLALATINAGSDKIWIKVKELSTICAVYD